MKNVHTPGPWRYEEATKTIRAVPSNYWLATMDSWDGAVNNEANARLIASAPDMLQALYTAARELAFSAIKLEQYELGPIRHALSVVTTAIEYAEGCKAKGESQ